MKKPELTLLLILSLSIMSLKSQCQSEATDSARIKVINYVYKSDRLITPSVDHTQFEALQREFKNAHEVTAACLECHNQDTFDVE